MRAYIKGESNEIQPYVQLLAVNSDTHRTGVNRPRASRQ